EREATMTAIAGQTTYTPEDLLRLPDGEHYELVDGELVEKRMGALSDRVAARILRRLDTFSEEHRLGTVFGAECGYRCFSDAPTKVRKPDTSFIAASRMAEEEVPNGHIP